MREKKGLKHPNTTVQTFFKLRHDQFLSGEKLAAMGELDEIGSISCPVCVGDEPETAAHYILKCSKFESQRESMLDTLKSTLKVEDLSNVPVLDLLLGVGNEDENNGSIKGKLFGKVKMYANHSNDIRTALWKFLDETLPVRSSFVTPAIEQARANAAEVVGQPLNDVINVAGEMLIDLPGSC
jgi:hypothetical protein